MNRFIRAALACGLAVAGLAAVSQSADAASLKGVPQVSVAKLHEMQTKIAQSSAPLDAGWACGTFATTNAVYFDPAVSYFLNYYGGFWGIEVVWWTLRAPTWARCGAHITSMPGPTYGHYVVVITEVAGSGRTLSGYAITSRDFH